MLLTVDQVAAALTMSKRTVWRLARTETTFPKPARLSPGCSRWSAEEVDEWKAERFAERESAAA